MGWLARAAMLTLSVLLLVGLGHPPDASAAPIRHAYLPMVMAPPPPAVEPQPPVEWRAVWVSRFDWTRYGHRPTSADIQNMVDLAVQGGFNAIIFQVRAAGDAYYTPGLEPWAARLTGTATSSEGQNPGWDPLAEMIRRAHAAGLGVHAWMNVYPAWQSPAQSTGEPLVPAAPSASVWPPNTLNRYTYSDAGAGPGSGLGLRYDWRIHSSSGAYQSPQWGQYLYANPNCAQVQDHIVAVAADIARRYDLDGLHLDYVRTISRSYSQDPCLQEACAIAGASCPGIADDTWRGDYQRAQISRLVKRVTQEAHAVRPGIEVSAAVWPVYLNVWGWREFGSGYYDHHQDSVGWAQRGEIDLIVPMLYTSGADGLTANRERWSAVLADFVSRAGGERVVAGIGVTGSDGCVPFEELVARIDTARAFGARGYAFFSMSGLVNCGYLDALRSGPHSEPAPWVRQAVPSAE